VSGPKDAAEAARVIYDAHSANFVEHAGTTFQAALYRQGPAGHEDPREHNLETARRAGLKPGDRVLDAGCGVGGPAMDAAEAFADVQVDALSISGVQVELGRKLAAERGLANRVRFTEGDYHELPFADATFDVVWYLESAEYAWDQRVLFGEAFRVLKPGGRLFCKGQCTRDGDMSDVQRSHLRELERVWGFARPMPTPTETWAAVADVGFEIESSQVLDGQVGQDRYVGAMVSLGDDGIPRMNAFGDAFFVPHGDIPLCFAEVSARKPLGG